MCLGIKGQVFQVVDSPLYPPHFLIRAFIQLLQHVFYEYNEYVLITPFPIARTEYTNIIGHVGITDIDLLSPYNYVPTEWVTLVFLVLFGISTGNSLSLSSSANVD